MANTKQKQLNKMALFTDYHVGKSQSLYYTSVVREYMDWFCNMVASDPTIDCVGFLGDWHETRSSIPTDTMNLTHEMLSRLDALNLPVYLVVGNHDLFNRENRAIHGCIFFDKFKNIRVIDEPMHCPEFDGSALFSPYLFHGEYQHYLKAARDKHLLGHFEFKGFVITGYSVTLESGPDSSEYGNFSSILSGHFHKRQQMRNVTYIGNTFCTSFGDANDTDRGAAVYEFDTQKLTFKNWELGPKFLTTTLSDLVAGSAHQHSLTERTHVRCIADCDMSYEDHMELKRSLTKEFGVRTFTVEQDVKAAREIVEDTMTGVSLEDMRKMTVDELVRKMLQQVQSDSINPTTLVDLYQSLRVE